MSKNNFEVFGKQVLLERIAMGGMAEIFLARSSGAGGITKFNAIKRILPQYSGNSEFISMFKDEAKINVNLSHSNIVPLYEFGVEKGQFYIVMEYVNGKNLRQILNRMLKESEAYFSIDQIVYIVREVAAGLDHAHRCLDGTTGKPLNIIHRDMSPQNIMISYEGEIKVVDFGIAKAESQVESTKAGTLKGKFAYMSPEQAGGEGIDLRTDIFSLGIVLWELLAKERLFTASNEINTLKKIREGKVPPIRNLNPEVNETLEGIVSKSLAKNKDERYQTCAEFQRDLNRFLNTHYPDYSSHDFSIFIKSLYADEILQNRKKLIEYSNIKIDTSSTENNSEATVIASSTQPDFQVDNKPQLDFEMGYSGTGTGTNINFRGLTTGGSKTSSGSGSQTQTGTPSNTSSRPNANYRYPNPPKKSEPMQWSKYAVFIIVACGLALIASQFFPSGTQEMASTDDETAAMFDIKPEKSIIINSNPPGAEIVVNNQPTGRLTPGRVKVPVGEDFKVELNKQGYIDYQRNISSSFNGRELFATLQKTRVGYLDIKVNRSRSSDVAVYINGTPMTEPLPIRKYKVPSNTKISIRAVDKRRRLYDEKKVELDVNQRYILELTPRHRLN